MFNVTHILEIGGLWLLATFIFTEVGLFLGFILPGDTLVLTAGVLAKEGKFALSSTIIVIAIAAIAGDNLAYWIGHRLGPKVFTKPDSLLLRKSHIDRAEKFYEKYGSKTVLIAHFFPVIRSFSPLLAGVGKMNYLKYFLFDVIGDIAWSIIVTLLGYYVASRIPGINNYINIVLAAIVAISVIPVGWHLYQRYQKNKINSQKNN
jgi:membrane-associated protein